MTLSSILRWAGIGLLGLLGLGSCSDKTSNSTAPTSQTFRLGDVKIEDKYPSMTKICINYKELGDQATSAASSDSAVVYFPTRGCVLDDLDKKTLRAAVGNVKNDILTITLEGFADRRGNDHYNEALSYVRASNVGNFVKTEFPNAQGTINITAYGESKSNNERGRFPQDRRVTVLLKRDPIERALDLLPADKYLLDASSSMTDSLGTYGSKSKWDIVKNYNYPGSAEIWVFSDCDISPKKLTKKELAIYRPVGFTSLLSSIYETVSDMKKGETLTVLTDGEDTCQGDFYKAKSAALKNNVKINIIQIGTSRDESILEDLAKSTGGNPPYKIYN